MSRRSLSVISIVVLILVAVFLVWRITGIGTFLFGDKTPDTQEPESEFYIFEAQIIKLEVNNIYVKSETDGSEKIITVDDYTAFYIQSPGYDPIKIAFESSAIKINSYIRIWARGSSSDKTLYATRIHVRP